MNLKLIIYGVVASGFTLASAPGLSADSVGAKPARENGLVKLLPSSTVMVAELDEPVKLIDSLLGHAVRARVESLAEVQQAMRKAEYIQFRLLLSWVELQLGMSWDETLRQVTANGAVAGVDAKTEGLAIIARGKNAEVVKRVVETLMGVARRDAKRRDVELPFQTHNYRGYTAYEFDELLIASLDDLLLITNKSELAKAIADKALDDKDDDHLANKSSYQAWQDAESPDSDIQVYLDLEFVRSAGIAKELFQEHAEDIAAEFILGMLMEALRDAPSLHLGLSLRSEQATIKLHVPHQPTANSVKRRYAFGSEGTANVPYELSVENAILSIASYRDLGELWLSKEELLDEAQIAELAQADSNLTTVFSGLDFGEEVLGAAQPGIQLLVASQDFETNRELPVPDIRLPSFALIFRLDNPDRIRRRFKIGFQSFVGFINIEQGQNGQPQFDVETTRRDGMQVTTAKYFVDERYEEAKSGLINYNFSPTIAFMDDWFLISSTEQLAVELLSNARSGQTGGASTKANTSAMLKMPELIEAFRVNQDHLVAQNMVEKGNTRKAALREVEIFLELLQAVQRVGFEMSQERHTMKLELTIDTPTAEGATLTRPAKSNGAESTNAASTRVQPNSAGEER